MAAAPRILKPAEPTDLRWTTRDGIAQDALYPPSSAAERATRARPRWQVAQRVDHPDPAEANALARLDLEGGADALTLVGAGAPGACGFGLALGRAGVMAQALAGVDLGAVALRLDSGADGAALARSLAALAARRHPAAQGLDFDFGIDPLGALAAAGGLPAPWDTVARDVLAVHADLRRQGFTTPILRADGRPWHAAGASEAQELAAVLSAGLFYLRLLDQAGVALEAGRAALSFALVADTEQLLTLAKFRSLRRLWARVEGVCGLPPRGIRLHGETAWRDLTRADPYGNHLRAVFAAFAAVVGGADSLTVLPCTQALGLADAEARRLARNSQLILAEEAHLWRVADPAAGAGAVEALTEALTLRAWALFQEIEAEGGLLASLTTGALQARIASVAAARSGALAEGGEILVGVTRFQLPEQIPAPVLMTAPVGLQTAPVWPLSVEPLRARRLAEAFETEGRQAS